MSGAGGSRFRRLGPEWVFLLVAGLTGLALIFLITPLAGGNEVPNFQRAVGIANGEWRVRPVMVPGGVADFLDAGAARFSEGAKPPYRLSSDEWQRLRDQPLGADRPKLLEPNAIAVLHPVAYLPQIPVIAAAQAVGANPLGIFLAGRLAGLLAALGLTFAAIRIVPFHKASLAALALLPPMVFQRSTFDADQFNTALALFFTASVLRAIAADRKLSGRDLSLIVGSAFLLAQAKSAYLLMPLLVLAIPAERFASAGQRRVVTTLAILPGALLSIGWMLLLKLQAFSAARYETWSGMVEPDRQLAMILHAPLGYAATLLRTIFTTDFIPRSILEMAGTFGPPVTMQPLWLVAVLVLAVVLLLSERALDHSPALRRFLQMSAGIAVLTVALILSLLYLQWTRVGGPVVDGWSGRYLFPLGLALLVLCPRPKAGLFGGRPERWLGVFAAICALSLMVTVVATYR